MIGLDTNVLARDYLDGHDVEAAAIRQRNAARRLLESDQPLASTTSLLASAID